VGPLAGVLILGVSVAPAALASPCAYPDEGMLPLRRAVTQVRLHPEIEGWARDMRHKGEAVQYALLLDEPLWADGSCYWTVEVRLGSQIHKKFFVTPAGKLKD
jgi:hypothetical protein